MSDEEIIKILEQEKKNFERIIEEIKKGKANDKRKLCSESENPGKKQL